MRPRLAPACALSIVALGALFPAQALGLERIESVFLSEYSAESFSIDQGEIVTFANEDKFLRHGIISDAPGAIEAPVIRFDQVRLLRGAPYLTAAGSPYAFHCPVHPAMTSVLNVTAAGAPLPPDGVDPGARVKLKTGGVGSLLAKRKLRIVATVSEPVDAVIKAGAAGASLGRAERTYVEPGRKAITLKLTAGGAAAVRREAAAGSVAVRMRLTLSDAAGNVAILKLNRKLNL